MLFMSQAMYGWGKVLQTYYGKNPSLMYEDPTVKYLGFWTDNGKCIVCHEVLGRRNVLVADKMGSLSA